MRTITATEARSNLFRLLDEAADTHEPIQIKGRRHSAVLLAEEDFHAIAETIHLLSVPGMKKSLLRARRATLKDYSTKRPW